MNPLVAQQLKEITSLLERLKEQAVLTQSQLQSVSKARDDLQTKVWRHSREIHVLNERLEEFAELKRESEHFHKLRSEFETRLQDILRYTRALTAQIPPS